MPQVDLCAGGKIGCEALADEPPSSIVVSDDAAEEWIGGRNSVSMERSSGIKTTSQRYSGKTKTKKKKGSFLGLPKPQKAAYAETKCRRLTENIRLFPKRRCHVSEPSSPKVSCIGRVRSRGSRRDHHRNPHIIQPKTGFWNNFRFMFRSRNDNDNDNNNNNNNKGEAPEAEAVKKSGGVRKREVSGACEAEPPTPTLGAANRFSSGRRSDAWAADVAMSQPLDHHDSPGSISQRCNGGRGPPAAAILVDRKWALGPVSV